MKDELRHLQNHAAGVRAKAFCFWHSSFFVSAHEQPDAQGCHGNDEHQQGTEEANGINAYRG